MGHPLDWGGVRTSLSMAAVTWESTESSLDRRINWGVREVGRGDASLAQRQEGGWQVVGEHEYHEAGADSLPAAPENE